MLFWFVLVFKTQKKHEDWWCGKRGSGKSWLREKNVNKIMLCEILILVGCFDIYFYFIDREKGEIPSNCCLQKLIIAEI